MPDPWTRNDNGLHDFDPAGVCRVCGAIFLDAAGYCPRHAGSRTLPAATDPDGHAVDGYRPRHARSAPPASPLAPDPIAGYGAGIVQAGLDGDGPCRIRCTGSPQAALTGHPDPETGRWLADYDPEGDLGQGRVRWTSDPAEAMVFDGLPAAIACWGSIPVSLPVRPDRTPNRPLTAWNVEFETAAGEKLCLPARLRSARM